MCMHSLASNLQKNESEGGTSKYVSKRKISGALLRFVRMSSLETYLRVAFVTDIADPLFNRYVFVDHVRVNVTFEGEVQAANIT